MNIGTLELEKSKKYFVTGGAGFIGSHLVDRLWRMGVKVTVYDKASAATNPWLRERDRSPRPNLSLVQGNLNDVETLERAIAGHDIVFHLAAFTNTRDSGWVRDADLKDGTLATWHLLEAMVKNNIGEIVFTSSQLVYGELQDYPIAEHKGPLLPISLYGASKLACEGMISAYSHLFDMQATICRLGNIMGGRMARGIVYDFIHKLTETPEHLEILGDGRQSRNYLLVDHCLDALLTAYTHETEEKCRLYNIGNSDTITATKVGQIVIEEMGLEDVTNISYTGDRRGWRGDVPNIPYDLSRIQKIGWTPQLGSADAICECTRRLLRDIVGQR